MHQISDFLQMGANIQCNSYFPGYYASGNHNLIANDSKRKHNLSTDHFEYYKEALKQTMLKQDTIFRNQVQDLHRLYGRQRELMDEIRRNEFEKHQQKMEASWLTTDLSRSSSVCVQKTLHVPSLPLVNPACSQISVSVAESFQSPSCFVRGRDIQTCSYPTQTEGRSGDSESLESKCNKFQKNFLDLELPADAYIDDEGEGFLVDGKVSEAPQVSSSRLIRFPEAVCNGDAKQFLGTDGYSSVSEDDTSTTASLQKGSVGLNYLHKLEKGTSPTSGLQFLSKEYIQDTWKRQDFEVCSNVLLQERKRKQELPSTDEAEKRKRTLNSFPPGSHADKLCPSSSLLHEELKAAEPPTLHQSNQNSWSGRTIFGLQNPRSYSQSGPSGASSMCTPYEHIPQGKMENSGASCSAAIRKPVHDFARFPMAVQALPCFNTPVPFGTCSKSSTVRPGINGDRLQLKNDLRSSTKHGSAFFLDDNFSNGSQLESKNSEPHISFDNLIRTSDNLVIELPGVKKDVMDSANIKSRKDINLNCVPTGCSLDAAVSQCFQATTGSEKLEASCESLPWHRRKLNGKTDKGCEDSTQAGASDFSSKIIRESTGHPSNSILNPPEEVKKRRKVVVLDLNADCDSVLDAEIELTGQVVENEFDRKDFGFQIALNSSTTGDGFSPANSLSTGILLEAPASPENKECSPPRGESDENQVETPFLLPGQDDPENNEFSPPIIQFDENQVVRNAAESLVSIGVGKHIASENFTVGGFQWAIYFYPDGKNPEDNSAYVSVFIALASEGTDVRALFELTLVDQGPNGKHKVHSHFDRSLESGPYTLKYRGSMWGYKRFFRRTLLESSSFLKDDCLKINCTVGVVVSAIDSSRLHSIHVPDSDIGDHFGMLLENEEGSDVTFNVCGERFHAHKLVLAARSPLFEKEFFDGTEEENHDIVVTDMDPKVFKALLHFIYTDNLVEDEELSDASSLCMSSLSDGLAAKLLAASDKYCLPRLRLMCESVLCKIMSVNSVAIILALADRYRAMDLKSVCLKFAAENLVAVMESDGFEYLKENCPLLQSELLKTVAGCDEELSGGGKTRSVWAQFSDGGDTNDRSVRQRTWENGGERSQSIWAPLSDGGDARGRSRSRSPRQDD